MNALTTTAMPLQDMQTLAGAIAKSGLFGIRTTEQALVLMAIAQAEGKHPVEAARDYDIINNRPAKKAEAMLRDFIQAGGKVEWHSLTDELADATFTHPQTGKVRIDWDMKRAKTAFGAKDMYSKFPRQMLRSRVVSEGVRTLWPLATSGMYVGEEIIATEPPHNGPTIDAEPDARDAINAAVPLKAAAADMPRSARISERAPPDELKRCYALDYEQWLAALGIMLANAQSRAEVEDIAEHPTVEHATAKAPRDVKERLTKLLVDAFGRFVAGENELPDVEIIGERHLGAG